MSGQTMMATERKTRRRSSQARDGDHTAGPRRMPKYEQGMIDLALRWLPFNGPDPSEIFVEFGVGQHEFYRRLRNLMTNLQPENLDFVVARALSQMCERQLELNNEPAAARMSAPVKK